MSGTVDTSDTITSKLEVALKLAKWLIAGEFVLFAAAFAVWLTAGTIGSIQLTGIAVYTIDSEVAEKAVNILLPITTGNVGALIGYILGKSKIVDGKIVDE